MISCVTLFFERTGYILPKQITRRENTKLKKQKENGDSWIPVGRTTKTFKYKPSTKTKKRIFPKVLTPIV